MLIEVSNTLTVENPTPEMVLWCKRNLTIPNPEYAKKSRMNLWLGNTPKVLSLYETRGTTLVLPFGTLRLLPKDISDKALFLSEFAAPVEVNYNADVPLYDYQEIAVQAMVAAKYGILQSAAGSGKTQMGIALAARLGRRTLWLCHTLDLIKQSKERANNKAANSYMNLYAKIKMAMGVVRTGARVIASWITQSNQYIEDLNLFTASMGKYAEEAQNYAEAVSEALGIDPGEFMRNQGVFNTIISGFGVASDKAYLMSKNLTQLGYDISSFFNISFEDAMQKLQSGISGELEPLRRLGYDLSVARLQEEALALGIEKKVSAMTQAEKSQLRYYAIMTQVTTAQGDMARTLNAPANQLRVLQSQVTQCARALGNIFIPALNAVLPYAIALAKIVRMLANSIASLFGFKLPEVDYSGISAGASAVGDLAGNAGDASDGLGKAGKAAKKLKNALLGIDELNVLSKDDSSSGSGSGSGAGIGGGDLGIDLPTYDFLGDVITSKVDEIVQMIKDAMWEITAVISGFLLAIGTILVVTGANIPLGLGLMAVGAVGLAASVMANWNGMSERLAKVLTLVTGVLGGFLLAIGAFLVFSGVNVPLGAGLMVAGAAALGTAAVINWKFLNGDLSNALSILTAIVSGALLAMGALFAFTGVDVPLGIALMAAGAVGMVTAIGLNWDSMDGVPALLDSLLDERLSLGRAKRMLLSNGQTK